MTIAVMGGAGYIGSHVVHALLRQGYTPMVYDDLSTGHHAHIPDVPFVNGNIADTEKLTTTFQKYQIDTVMHFAGSILVGESVKNPILYYENNVMNSFYLLNAVLNCDIPYFIYSSTCAVYGMPQEIPITENHPCQPVNPYGRTKLAIEYLLGDYAQAYPQFNYISLRYFNACGADPIEHIGECHDPETHLIPLAIQTALEQRATLHIYGTDYPTSDGTCIRDYIHVNDLAAAHILATRFLQEKQTSHVFNLGNGTGYSVREVIRSVERIAGKHIPIIHSPRRAGDPPVLVGSSNKARTLLHWSPQYTDLDQIVNTAWRWHNR